MNKIKISKIKIPRELYFPLVASLVLLLLPIGIHDNSFMMNILIVFFIWAVVAAAWDLLIGYARIVSFAQIALFTIGAYTSSLLAVHLGVSPWLGMWIGGFAAAAIGLLIGLPCLRLTGIFIAVVTFAVHLILTPVIMETEEWTAGSMGFAVPTPQIGGYVFSSYNLVPWYYVGFAIFAVSLYAIYRIIRSPLGLAFVALRDSEPFAKAFGVDEYKYKLILFGISSFITGIMGAFYAHYNAMLSPAILGLDTFLLVLIMMIFGGLGKFPGAVIGAFVITLINEFLRPTGTLRYVILGGIVIATMIYLPGGLVGIGESIRNLVRRKTEAKRTT